MTRWIALAAFGLLAACGVDGEPIQPSMTTNVGVGKKGVSGSIGTSIVSGNMSVHVGTAL